jgi:hypothetical protein
VTRAKPTPASSDLSEVRERLVRVETLISQQGDLLKSMDAKLDARATALDGRLRDVEVRSGIFGTVAGGVISLGIAYVTQRLRSGV